jgi:sec-independent protein translocase protein TatC
MAKKKKDNRAEMPFLDHLEELRWRILWSLIAIVVGSIIGYFLVGYFDVVSLLKAPIDPFLREGRLVFTRPADAFLIRLKLSMLVGLIIAFPVVFYQVWAFLAPALYDRERRHVFPALISGIGLFAIGAWMAYLWIMPAALRIMLSDRFVGHGLEPFITAGDYFTFATQVILAAGFVFELPLVMILLAMFGIIDPQLFARNRRYAVLVGAIVAAFVTPPDAFTMVLMMIPILLLYEVGIAVGKLVWKRRSENVIGD